MEISVSGVIKFISTVVVAFWLGLEPAVQLLLAFMILDIISGVFVAGSKKEIDSGVAWEGMIKKALMLCLVVMGSLLESYTKTAVPGLAGVNIPISEAIAGFFAASEGLSCVENAGKAGVPIPQFLRDVLAKLSPENKT